MATEARYDGEVSVLGEGRHGAVCVSGADACCGYAPAEART